MKDKLISPLWTFSFLSQAPDETPGEKKAQSVAGCAFPLNVVYCGRLRSTARNRCVGGVSQLILRPSFSSMDGNW
jgi:hypothetical protein